MYDMKTFRFGNGSHKTREDGMCVMECVAYLAGEPHADHPQCASPVITELAIWLNDSFGPDDDARQKAFEPISPLRIIGTRATSKIEQQRAFMAADFAVRFVCPRLLGIAGLNVQAETLRNLPAIDSEDAARAAIDAARAAIDAAIAAIDAASAAIDAARAARAAIDAASDAAIAAIDAAIDAARAAIDAARAARAAIDAASAAIDAASAAIDAARAAIDAARAARAARDAASAIDEIRAELIRVIDRMIRLTEPQEMVPVREPECAAGN